MTVSSVPSKLHTCWTLESFFPTCSLALGSAFANVSFGSSAPLCSAERPETLTSAFGFASPSLSVSWSSPRPISSSQLHTLLYFHPCPIYLVVFKGSYSFRMGYLILRGASRLDAFSVYPFPAWLLGHRLGSLTDAPAASPSRSSRTKDSSSQISFAHAG